MNEFDQFVKSGLKVKHYIRYADDIVFLSDDRGRLLIQLPIVEAFLEDRLHLYLHPDKISIQTFASGVDFLGWKHFSDHNVLRTKQKSVCLKSCKIIQQRPLSNPI